MFLNYYLVNGHECISDYMHRWFIYLGYSESDIIRNRTRNLHSPETLKQWNLFVMDQHHESSFCYSVRGEVTCMLRRRVSCQLRTGARVTGWRTVWACIELTGRHCTFYWHMLIVLSQSVLPYIFNIPPIRFIVTSIVLVSIMELFTWFSSFSLSSLQVWVLL